MIQSIGPKSPEIQEIHEILNNDSILPYFDVKEYIGMIIYSFFYKSKGKRSL